MNKQLHRHNDCRNYTPVDVVKGICLRTKDLILGDENQCEHFDQINKCKFCGNFSTSKEEFMGTCNGLSEQHWTYPDLITVTCEGFKAQA
jgi:4-hydroxyphenylacetate decarboxylase small subunit